MISTLKLAGGARGRSEATPLNQSLRLVQPNFPTHAFLRRPVHPLSNLFGMIPQSGIELRDVTSPAALAHAPRLRG
jgi:hypothetical protein